LSCIKKTPWRLQTASILAIIPSCEAYLPA